MRIRRVFILILSLLMSLSAMGIPARKGIYTMSQPDGSTFSARLQGDEFIKILTTIDGSAIIQDTDGWYSYAYYDALGGKHSSGVHVGTNSGGIAAAASRSIPYSTLNRQAAQMRALRSRISSSRSSAAPPTRADASKKKALIVLAQFKDLKFRYGRSNFVNMLTAPGYSYNGAQGSALDYFNDQFGSSADFEFTVSDIVTLPKGYAYYGANDAKGHDEHAAEVVSDACKLLDDKIDFSQFDLDRDGEVDNVFVFVPGTDEAEGADEDHIWSHQWYLYDGAGIRLNLDGKLINSYAISTEISHDLSTWKEIFTTIGTFCHEYSHVLGLPDLYDTDYEDSDGQSDGVWGTLSLMDHGNFNNDGNTPPNFNALELELLGLGRKEDLALGSWTLKPISEEKRFFRANSDTSGEYWLFECRDKSGWDKYIGGSGMLIYHIDRSKRNTGYSTTYERDLTAEMRWIYNEINCRPSHQCVDLIECVPSTKSVSQVFWPSGTRTSFTKDTTPAFKHWSGKSPEFSILNIKRVDNSVSFSVAGPISINSIEAFQDAAIIQWNMAGSSEAFSYISISGPSGKWEEVSVKPYQDGLYSYTIEGLSEKTTYKLMVSTKPGRQGTTVDGEFTTKSYYSDGYPFIYLNSADRTSEGYFVKGSQMPLRVYNAKNAVKVSWTFNGSPVEDDGSGYWTVRSEGTLRAYVDYTDGTTDVLAKKISITVK